MAGVNETHDPARRSWVKAANEIGCDFPIQNLPFGIFRAPGRDPRGGVAMVVIYARFSDSVSGFDQDQITYTGVPGTVRDREISVELTYVAQIISGWTVQPDFQYISHPNGQAGRDAEVAGIRSTWNY
jgi:carbohydrate-selective porin OprB